MHVERKQKGIQPKGLRMLGAYLLLASAVCVALDASGLWSTALVIAPALALLGLWLLLDARALAHGEHRLFWVLVGTSSMLGAGILGALTTRF